MFFGSSSGNRAQTDPNEATHRFGRMDARLTTSNTGTGLFAFRNMEEAIEAIKEVESDYQKHSEASMKIAEGYFDSDKFLTELLNQAFES